MRFIFWITLFIYCSATVHGQLCKNGVRLAIDGTCKDYMECVNNYLVHKSCGLMKLFDPKYLTCRMSWLVDCVDKSSVCSNDNVYPHPDGCGLYYECVGGRLFKKSCPLFKVFDASLFKTEPVPCRFGFGCQTVECSASESRAIPGDCSLYEQCQNGIWVRSSCFIGYRYNPYTEKCELGGCQQCTHGETTSLEDSCRDYLYCERGLWTEKSCSMFKKYDPQKRDCVWFFQYTCPSVSSVLATETCVGDEKKKVEGDRTKYMKCFNGAFAMMSCEACSYFDPEKNNCVYDSDGPCRQTETQAAQQNAATTQPGAVKTQSSASTKRLKSFILNAT